MTETPTASVPTVEPTPLPTVHLDMATIITTTQQLAAVELDAWRDGATSQFFISLGIIPLVFSVLLLLMLGSRLWRRG